MRKLLLWWIGVTLIAVPGGCAKQVRQYGFESPDHKLLYELMVERCKAVSEADMARLRQVYAKDSPEFDWLASRIHYLSTFTFQVTDVEKISIVGVDAAGRFAVSVFPSREPSREVDVLYVKEGDEWKIESVAETRRY